MLVLSRKKDEAIVINGGYVTLVAVDGDKATVKVSNDSPVVLHRSENGQLVPIEAAKTEWLLTLEKDELISYSDTLSFVVVDIRGDKVRFGINSTRDDQVHRQEIWEAINREYEKRPKSS